MVTTLAVFTPSYPTVNTVRSVFHISCRFLDYTEPTNERVQADGYLFADTDNGYCPTTIPSCTIHGQRVFSCPKLDKAGYSLGPGSQTQDDDKILFCTYPTTSQLSNNAYFCRYALVSLFYPSQCKILIPSWQDDGHLYWGIDPVFGNNPPPAFCPLSAVCPTNFSANATQTTIPHCPAITSSIATSKALAPYRPTKLKSSAILAIVMITASLWFV
jgi:hypothetical protein